MRHYFRSPIAYFVVAVFLIATGYFFNYNIFYSFIFCFISIYFNFFYFNFRFLFMNIFLNKVEQFVLVFY